MLKSLMCLVSTVVVQRFCKPLVGGSNPSPGTIFKDLRQRNFLLTTHLVVHGGPAVARAG